MEKKNRILIYFALLLAIPLGILIYLTAPLIISGNIGHVVSHKDESIFWFAIIGITLLLSLFTYFILSRERMENIFQTNIQRRNTSNDIFFILFILGYFIWNLPQSSTVVDITNPIHLTYTYYQRYEIIALMSIPLIKLYQLWYRKRNVNKTANFLSLGNAKDYGKLFIYSALLFISVYVVGLLFQNVLFGLATLEGREYIILMLCATIPFEELVFRGLGYIAFLELFKEIFGDILKIPRKERNNHSQLLKISNVVTIIITSFLFGIYHLGAYGFSIFSIAYLIALGFAMAIGHYYFGLFVPFLIHSFNNVLVNIGANLTEGSNPILDFLFSSKLTIMLLCLYVILLLGFIIKKNRGERNKDA